MDVQLAEKVEEYQQSNQSHPPLQVLYLAVNLSSEMDWPI
jgi:hypothetical protein